MQSLFYQIVREGAI